MLSKEDKKLAEIKKKVLECTKCSLSKNRNWPVIGQGSHRAKVVFIGEAPGKREDETGKPFCGQAGRILNELLESIDLAREDVYISNLIKCRPPNNRDPRPEEIRQCQPYLQKQIKIIKPKLICSLGRHSMTFLMKELGLQEKISSIGQLHGQVFKANLEKRKIKFIPLYHPAAALYRASMKEVLKKDFQKIVYV